MTGNSIAVFLLVIAAVLAALAIAWQSCGLSEVVSNTLVVLAIILLVGSVFFLSAPDYLWEVDVVDVPRELMD